MLSPAANCPRTCSTARRRPRMMGLPPNIFGLNVILARSVGFFMRCESEWGRQETVGRCFGVRLRLRLSFTVFCEGGGELVRARTGHPRLFEGCGDSPKRGKSPLHYPEFCSKSHKESWKPASDGTHNAGNGRLHLTRVIRYRKKGCRKSSLQHRTAGGRRNFCPPRGLRWQIEERGSSRKAPLEFGLGFGPRHALQVPAFKIVLGLLQGAPVPCRAGVVLLSRSELAPKLLDDFELFACG